MYMRTLRLLLCALVVLSVACGDDDGATPPPTPDMGRPAVGFTETRHTFPALTVEAGEDLGAGSTYWPCLSWTLNNEEPLYVNSVRFLAGPGWHHSNWMYVPDTSVEGPDGEWDCRERGFSEGLAIVGGVFFAQSTQVTDETQQFPPGAAFVIPPHSRIVGGIHLINFESTAVTTDATFELGLVPEAEVTKLLQPLSLNFADGFVVPAASSAAVSTGCDIADAMGEPLDFNIYYVLPHYHQYATNFRLEAVGGTRDGDIVFETDAALGDPLGAMLEVPFNMTGATGLRMTCAYDNYETFDLLYRNADDGEMCVLLAYTDAPVRIYGASTGTPTLTDVDGLSTRDGACSVITARPPRR